MARFLLSLLLLAVSASSVPSAETGRPPNIVFILADDLGYAELGCYGQTKIQTPNIDRLAREGMRFTDHHCGNAVCAPSRCVLMTGKHSGHAYVRNNRQANLPDELLERYGTGFPGQEPIPDSEVTVAEVLKQKGYATAAIGKWGLGHFGTTGDPNKQGFDLFFGYNCQAHAHSYYPAHLWLNGRKYPLKNDPPVPGHAGLAEGADPNDPASYASFKGQDYAPDHMIDQALRFIEANKEGPFFLYFPSTIPHVALHIPDEDLKPYLGKWDDPPFTREKGGYTPNFTPRAAYAAMISRLDKSVGQITAQLEKLGLDENTLIMFSSDNGTTHIEDEVDYKFFQSVGPLRGLKGSLYEGGIRVPLIARWKGKIAPSTTSDLPSAFYDVMPTLADVAGAEAPKEIDGISFLPTLLGEPDKQEKHAFLYWEFPAYGGQQAVRIGPWKAVRQNMTQKKNPDPLKIELYNLAEDIGEQHDLAAEKPQIVQKAREIMKTQHIPSEIFKLLPLDE